MVEVDDFRYSLRVYGDRHWLRNEGGELAPSAPVPFVDMPIGLDHAYGGKSTFDELPVTFPDNPEGKGFYAEEEEAENHPLPNVEDPRCLIQKWDDRPTPVGIGLCPAPQGAAHPVRRRPQGPHD